MINEIEKVKTKEEKVGFGTLMLWQSRAISASIVVLVFGYLMIYSTDTLKVPAAYVSIILVASKVLDGVTDMVAGFIVDRTKTKWGKARPYEIFIIGLWLCTWLLFSCPPSLSLPLKCAWIFIMYSLANSICYTFLNANSTVYTVRAFKGEQIVKITSYGSVVTMLSAVIFNVVFPSVMGKIATSPAGWSRLILILAVPMTAIGILRMFFIPEKYDIDAVVENNNKVQVKDVLTVVKTNKYILLIILMTFIFNFVCNMGVNVYYFTYIVGNIGLMGITGIAQIIALPLAFTFPKLIRRFSTAKLMTIGFAVSAVGYLINFLAGKNILLLSIGAILTGAGTIPASMLIALVVIECADFNEWKGAQRLEGTMSSFVGFGSKVGAALGTGSLGIVMSLSGYTGDVTTMSQGAYTMIRLMYSLVPMALYIITALSMKTYKLDKLMPQIKADNESRRSAKAAENEKKE
jgi:Na+/melibiose symporter-like transporter